MEHELNLEKHLSILGVDSNAIKSALPKTLTLSFQDGVLSLCERENCHSKLSADYLVGPIAYRGRQHLGGENLIKACQMKGNSEVKILDGTCGLGTDSFLLHQAGFKVTAMESNPVIHALLKDGLHRYRQHTENECFELQFDDVRNHFKNEKFDVIYLDPMFPTKVKSAKNKKNMQLFQAIHSGEFDDAKQLLELALKTPCQRVVIKRPSKSDVLTAYKPTFQVLGKTCRFDAYQIF